MRITFATTYQKLSRDINQKAGDVSRLTTQVASGSRLQKQADDPAAWSQALDLRQSLRQIESFQENISFATSWNETTESALTGAADVALNAKNLAIQAISARSEEKTDAQLATVNRLIEEALTLANTQYDDRYVFSAQQDVDTPPYAITFNPDGTYNYTCDVDEGELQVRVGDGTFQTVNQNGLKVFGDESSGLLKQLLDLRDALTGGDTDALGNLVDELGTTYADLQNQSSIVGSRLDGLEAKTEMYDTIKLQQESQLSDVADADMAEVITQLTQKTTLYEAVLSVTSMVKDLNLLQYL